MGRRVMKVMDRLGRIRSQRGNVRLAPGDSTRIQMKRGNVKPRQWKVWKKALLENRESVIACLKEERASSAWEASGRDPAWWQTYEHSGTAVVPACTCDALLCPHNHGGPYRTPNVTLDPGETIWHALTRIVCAVRSTLAG